MAVLVGFFFLYYFHTSIFEETGQQIELKKYCLCTFCPLLLIGPCDAYSLQIPFKHFPSTDVFQWKHRAIAFKVVCVCVCFSLSLSFFLFFDVIDNDFLYVVVCCSGVNFYNIWKQIFIYDFCSPYRFRLTGYTYWASISSEAKFAILLGIAVAF